MKILLVATPQSDQSIDSSSLVLLEPLALEYLGAAVKENHDVKLLDLRSPLEPGLKETLESFQPDIIGCGAYTTEVNSAKQICAEAKRAFPEILTVVGGPHPTVMPEDLFDENIDVVTVGEGTQPFKKICECHEKQKSFEDIENIYYRKNKTGRNKGKMEFTKKKEHPPLDSLPFPDRTLTSHLRHKYQTFILNNPMPIANVRGSVGCIYRCKFCSVSGMLNHKMYKHSIERIVAELEMIDEPAIFWVDDEFIVDPKRAIDMARAIKEAGIKKYHLFMGRADTIVNHAECIEKWAEIGLKYVFIGMESHREKDLKKMRKGTSVSTNEKAVRILHANDVKLRGAFIIQPDYDKQDFRKLLKYVRELDVDVPAFSVYTPLPGTDLYKEEKDNFITRNYNLFDVVHAITPTKLPLKKFYKEYVRICKRIIPFKKRIKILRELDPEVRRALLSNASKFLRKIKNAHRDYA